MRGQHACSQSGPPSTPQITISHLLAESARGICGISQPIVAPNHARSLSRGWFNVRLSIGLPFLALSRPRAVGGALTGNRMRPDAASRRDCCDPAPHFQFVVRVSGTTYASQRRGGALVGCGRFPGPTRCWNPARWRNMNPS